MAISEVSTKILFIAGVMKFLGMDIVYPIEINVDNISAIYLSKNATMGNHTKHMDTRYHFVRECIKKGIVKIVFVRSEDNKADLMTKNLGNDLYAKHTKGMFEIWDCIFDIWHWYASWIIHRKGVKIYVPYPDALGSDNEVMLMGLKQKWKTRNSIVNSDIVVILSSYKNCRE